MSASILFLKLALSTGISALSKFFGEEETTSDKHKSTNTQQLAKILNNILGDVAPNFIHQYADQIDYKALTRFLIKKDGEGYDNLNHDLEKLMIRTVPKTFRYLRETYEGRYEAHKGDIAFLKNLEKQAGLRINNDDDLKQISQNKAEWLLANRNYAWLFAEDYIAESKYDTSDLHLDFIKEFIETHFERAFEIVYNEGLKDQTNEKPIKAFIIKTLKGIDIQTQHIGESQKQILEKIEILANGSNNFLTGSRNYLDEKWRETDSTFKKDTINFFKEISKKLHDIAINTDAIGKSQKDAEETLRKIRDKVAPAYPHTLSSAPPRIDLNKYVERGSFLENLHGDLLRGNNALLLNGLGGMGKSTQAAMYVQKYGEVYDHIAWLTQVDTFENMLLGAQTLLDNLKISLKDIDPLLLPSHIFKALPKPAGKKLLLVLDNVDESIIAYKDILPADYKIILTSRERVGLGFSEKYIGRLTFPEAEELINKHLQKTKPDQHAVRDFCELLDYHTLSIELLIKTLEESLELQTLSQLTEFLESNRLDAEELQESVFTNHSRAEVAVYRHLLQCFTLAKLSEKEKWVLLQFAILPPLEHEYTDLSEWVGEDKRALAPILKTLHKKGWLDHSGSCFAMHRMVQVLVRHQIPPDDENTKVILETFTQKLSIDQTKDNPVDKFQWVKYGKFMFNTHNHDVLNMMAAQLANNLALVLKELGDYQGAKKLLEKALLSAEQKFGENHPTTAIRYSNLATILQDLDDYEGARRLLEKALLSAEQKFGEKHPTTAVRYSNLATVLRYLGDYEGARRLLEKALLSAEQNFGEKHPTTAVIYSNLALVLKYLGDYDGAKKLLEKALLSAEQNFGEKHPMTAIGYSNLATVLQDLGDYEGARKLLEKALHWNELNFGEKHPTTVVSYSNLALVLKDLGYYESAKKLLEKALVSDEQNFGEKHPTTAVRYSNLATVLQDLGDYRGARKLLKKALVSDEQTFGEKHPKTAIRYHNYGTVLASMNQPCDGLTWCKKAYSIFHALLGPDHPNTKTVKSWVDKLTSYCDQRSSG